MQFRWHPQVQICNSWYEAYMDCLSSLSFSVFTLKPCSSLCSVCNVTKPYNPSRFSLLQMKEDGWEDKPNVHVVHGRWQDVMPQLGQYDGIFFDTFGEDYEDLHEFQNQIIHLLRPGGLYSYFNGLSADNVFFHMVSCEVVKCELAAKGLSTSFIPLPINVSDPAIWQGILNKYWQLDTYLLPIVQWTSTDSGVTTCKNPSS